MKKMLFIAAIFYSMLAFSVNASADECIALGYTKTVDECPGKSLKCPSNPLKVYCNPCGDGRGYRFDKTNCDPISGMYPAGVECGGKWTECRECGDSFRYNKSNCRAPKVLNGAQCGESYENCSCPSGYSARCAAGQTCSGTQDACGCKGTCVTAAANLIYGPEVLLS